MTRIEKISEFIARPGLVGRVEIADFGQITGWAADSSDASSSVRLEVSENGEPIAFVVTEGGTDPDAAGRFRIAFHHTLFPNARHVLNIRFADTGVDLEGSPVVLEREGFASDPHNLRRIEEYFVTGLDTTRHAGEADEVIAFLLRQLNDYVNIRAELSDVVPFQARIDREEFTNRFSELIAGIGSAYSPIAPPTSSHPLVSIIIPVYNKFDYTYRCIQSIARSEIVAPYEIIVVDDLSTDETMLSSLVFGSSVRIVRNRTNLGFVRGCNAGAKAARGRFLYFLNNDTEVKPHFLDELVRTFLEVPNVGIAGSKLVFPDGSLQEAGGIIWRMGDGWNWGRGQDPEHPRYMYLRDADYVSGAALMIEASVFNELGGFDELFAPAYYEDTDLCFRVRAAGRRVVVQPRSEIIHYEGISSGTDTSGTGVKRYQVVNQRKFLKRWVRVLAGHRMNGDQPELEAERPVSRRALFIDETVPTPKEDAGSNAAVSHMRGLQRLGYKVTFVPGDNMARIDPYTGDLQRLGIECLYHPYYPSVEEILKRSTVQYDVVYLHRFINASKYAGLVRRFMPGTKIVFNVADVHFLRMEREARVEKDDAKLAAALQTKRVELGAMAMVDSVIVHSDFEAELLSEELEDGAVYVVPWAIPLRQVDKPFEERSGIGFIGGYNHRPNVDAARYLVEHIMPVVWEKDADVRCVLAGSKMPPELKALQSDQVEAMGWVESLESFFGGLRLTVAPLRYGAGVKGKVLDSLAAGVPCIMTPIAAEGIPLPAELHDLVVEDARDMGERIAALHGDLDRLTVLSALCIQFVRDTYSDRAVDTMLSAAVAGS